MASQELFQLASSDNTNTRGEANASSATETNMIEEPGQLELISNQQPENSSAMDARENRRRRQTFMILFGCGLLQFPIWGMAMSFGIFEAAYTKENIVSGSSRATGVIGTTMNGVIYLSIPCLSVALESPLGIRWRRVVAIAGVILSAAAFLISSWSLQVTDLIALQGVVAALGTSMLYTPTTLWVNEWFRNGKRATAQGVQFSSKNLVGTATPFIMYGIIDSLGVRWTLRIWAVIVLVTGLIGVAIIPKQAVNTTSRKAQKIPWSFLKHRTFYIYAFANTAFSSGYGLPQTYLSTYADQVLHLSGIESALQIAIFNAPGILSCTGFGMLSDKARVSASVNTLISALGSALCVFLLWGTKSNTIPALLISFSVGYGFFAGGYSSTWGGWMNDIEREARDANEAISMGMVYGMMNGARGIGYVVGGVSGVELLKAGSVIENRKWALGTKYGGLILFTGLSSLMGGWSVVWKGCGWRRRGTVARV